MPGVQFNNHTQSGPYPILSQSNPPTGHQRLTTSTAKFSSAPGQKICHRKASSHPTLEQQSSKPEIPYFLNPNNDEDKENDLIIAIRQSIQAENIFARNTAVFYLDNCYIPDLKKLTEELKYEDGQIYLSAWINFPDNYSYTPLKEATRNGALKYIEALIVAGANPLLEMGTTSLHEALYNKEARCHCSRYDVMKTLLESIDKIRPETLDQVVNKKPCSFKRKGSMKLDNLSQRILSSQNTVLHEVLFRGNITIAETVDLTKLLLKYGANPLIKNAHNETAFSLLYLYEDLDKELLEPMIDAVPLKDLDMIFKSPCMIPMQFRQSIQNLVQKRKEDSYQNIHTLFFTSTGHLSEIDTPAAPSREIPPQSPMSILSELTTSSEDSDFSESMFEVENDSATKPTIKNGDLVPDYCSKKICDINSKETDDNLIDELLNIINMGKVPKENILGEAACPTAAKTDYYSPHYSPISEASTGEGEATMPVVDSHCKTISLLQWQSLSDPRQPNLYKKEILSGESSEAPTSPGTITESYRQPALGNIYKSRRSSQRLAVKRSLEDIDKIAPSTGNNSLPPRNDAIGSSTVKSARYIK